MNNHVYFLKSATARRTVGAGMILAFLCQLPKLTAQVANPGAQVSTHNDLFTKPAATDRAPVATAGDFISAPPVEQQLHLVVGRSVFVNTRHRLTRVYVTSPSILDSYTASPNQVVITAKKPGSSNLIVWDEAGESQAFRITSDVDVAELRDALKQALPNDNVQVAGQEGRVVLTGTIGTDKISDQVVKLAGLYSKDVTNALLVNPSTVKQVTLKVRIVEVDRAKLNAFAFNFFSAGGTNIGGTTTGQAPSSLTVAPGGVSNGKQVTISNPLNFLLYSSRLNIGATLQDLQTLNVLQILSEPTITAMSGEKGSFLAGGEFPFPVVQAGASGGTAITIQFRPYGVKLDFIPTVNSDGTVELHVAPEVSSLDYSNEVQIAGYTVPALSTRRAETQVVLRSGQTFVISGILDRRATDQFASTPGIASVPILGQLFKSKSVNHTDQELVVIVTPTIVDPLTDTAFPDEPHLPIPNLDVSKFDKMVPSATKTKQ